MEARDRSFHPDVAHPGQGYPSDWISKPRSIIFATAVLFILIFGIAIFLGLRQFNDTRNNLLAADKTTANLLADLLLQHNKANIGIFLSYANRPLLVNAVKKKDIAGIDRHLADLKKNGGIDTSFVADKRGILWTNLPVFPESRGKDFSQRDWYKGISAHWKPYISAVFKQVVGDKLLAVTVCVPIFDEKRRPIGILGNSQRLNFIDDTIEKVAFDSYTTVNVIDRVGKIIYSNKIDYIEKITDYPFFPIIEQALKGKKQQIEIQDPRKDQEKRYLTIVPAADIGWTITIERSLRDIYRSDLGRFMELGTVAFLLFLLIIVFLVYLRKASLARKTEELLEAEKKIKQRDETLRVLSSRQEAILASVPAMIMEVDNNKVYTWANSAGIEFFGEDVISKEAAFYFEGEQGTYNTVRPLFNGVADIIYLESWQRRKDGEKRLLSWWCRVLKGESGCVTGALSSAYDITEHKRTEEALSRATERLMLAVQAGGIGIWEWDVVNNQMTWDDQMFCLYGIGPDRFGGTYEAWCAGVHPEDLQQVETEVQMALEGKKEFHTEFRVVWQDGTIRHLSARACLQRDPIGQPVRLIGTNHDITENKLAEAEIKKLNAELEQRVLDRTCQLETANKELDAFSYSVSHDLRAPLRSIEGFSQALLEEYGNKLDDIGKSYLERVRKATQRMGFLIDDLLKLSRMTRVELKKDSMDLSKMVRAIAEAQQKNNPDRAVDVVTQEGCVVQGDPYLIQIALSNLVDNAFKFTGNTAHPRIEFGTTVMYGKSVCFIRDNGVGFDMTYMGKLFGAFQRLHTKEEFPGTGIGLVTVKRIINRHGGEIWAEAEVGKGATFYFTLP